MSSLIPKRWEVPEIFRLRLGNQGGRQRAMIADGHLLLILHGLPVPGKPERETKMFWRNPAGEWRSSDTGSGKASLQALFTNYTQATDSLEASLAKADRASEYFTILRQSTPILRAARHMHGALQHARESLPNALEIINFRDQAGELERALELVYADARLGLEFSMARRAEEQAELSEHMVKSSHRLNLLAATFFPLSAIAAVFGMNLSHGLPIATKPIAFWAVVGASLLLGLIIRTSMSSGSKPKPEK
jgi:hypothetical protein